MTAAEKVVNEMLDSKIDEGRWKSLAAAGLMGAAALHPGAKPFINRAHQAITRAMEPGHMQIADPNQELPSEKNLSDWDYVEKKSNERSDVAKRLKPVTNRYFSTGS